MLIVSEMATGTFITLGFGTAAIVVGVVDLIIHLEVIAQLGIWIVLSTAFVVIFFKWFKRTPTVSSTGQSSYGFDIRGSVTQAIRPHRRGKVTFDTPVLGTTEWNASSSHDLEEGRRIKIVEVNGQLIEVEPID
jgi:hypothetical protein